MPLAAQFGLRGARQPYAIPSAAAPPIIFKWHGDHPALTAPVHFHDAQQHRGTCENDAPITAFPAAAIAGKGDDNIRVVAAKPKFIQMISSSASDAYQTITESP